MNGGITIRFWANIEEFTGPKLLLRSACYNTLTVNRINMIPSDTMAYKILR